MVREICTDQAFLAQKAEPATPEDREVARDLLDTLAHHKDGCVGMAANMIGVNKRIIAFDDQGDAIRDTAYIKTADTANNVWKLETVQTVE